MTAPRVAMTAAAALAFLWQAAPAFTISEAEPVGRFLSRREQPIVSYEGRRILRARNPRFRKEGWLDVEVRFSASGGMAYRIAAQGGSSQVIGRALIPALDAEVEMWTRGDPERYGLTPANYEFTGEEPSADEDWTEARVGIKPRASHPLLVLGSLFVSPDGDLLRVEGRLSKGPSFWTRRVDVIRTYRRVAGVRVPSELHSWAHVWLAGRSELQVQYLYDTINGRAVHEP